MNFDDVKSNYQSLSYSGENKGNVDLARKVEDAVERVRIEDQRDKRRLLAVSILLAGFGLMYGLIGLIKYIANPERTEYWGYIMYVLALMAVTPFIINKYRQNRSISYDVPVIQFIEHVEKRFALFQFSQLWLIPFILIINASFVFMIARSRILTVEIILRSQIIFILICTFALLFRVIAWRKKLFLLDELRRIKESMK